MIALAAFAISGCLVMMPGSDSIRAGDLAPAFPEMKTLDPSVIIAPGPLPGLTRVFHPPELGRLAIQFGLASSPQSDICIARKVAPLDRERLVEAMRREMPSVEIELLEFSLQPAPEGTIRFPRAGLHIPPEVMPQGTVWRGWVQYGEKGRFPIWVRVRVSLSVRRGDKVKVRVRSGGAQLELDAVADGPGTAGDTIYVVNPESHRRFPARVEAAGRVVVEAER